MGRRPLSAVVSIGCTEPWNAAGLGLDVRALAACDVRPLSVVAGVTAQDAGGVRAAASVAPDLIAAQLEALARAEVGAYRIGALLDAASVDVIVRHLRAHPAPAVFDPVLAPSGGGRFADDATREALRRLLPVVTLVTPNLSEAAELTSRPVRSRAEMEAAARALVTAGAGAALVTGGHLSGAPVDVLAEAVGTVAFEASRLPGTLRGTGCLLACGIAAALAKGASTRDAVSAGRAFVRERFAAAVPVAGMRLAF